MICCCSDLAFPAGKLCVWAGLGWAELDWAGWDQALWLEVWMGGWVSVSALGLVLMTEENQVHEAFTLLVVKSNA